MSANVGNVDRILRIIIGIALLSMVFFGPQTPWGWLGLVAIGTALIGYCPLYTFLGVNTCPAKTK